jgi:hypothetical protein
MQGQALVGLISHTFSIFPGVFLMPNSSQVPLKLDISMATPFFVSFQQQPFFGTPGRWSFSAITFCG